MGSGNGTKDRPILENKSILSIKVLGESKGDYPAWIEDMKDTLEDLRPGMGDFIEWIEGLGAGVEENIKNEFSKKMGIEYKEEAWNKIQRDLWSVVNKTTEDGTRRKVKSGTRGDGVGALYRVVKWFQRVTGLGLSEKRARLMRPGTAKNEGDILGMLKNWKREVRELERMEAMLNEGESMTDRTKVSAVKQMYGLLPSGSCSPELIP
jgi:hypothetical protein